MSRRHLWWQNSDAPEDPKGRKRPADVIRNAVHAMRIATGEIQEPPDTRNQVAAEIGNDIETPNVIFLE